MALENILIADTCTPRIEEIVNIGRGFTSNIIIFDGSEGKNKMSLVSEAQQRVDRILEEGDNVLLISNLVVGIHWGLFQQVRKVEALHNVCIRKILLTCKGTTTVQKKCQKAKVSQVGIRHIRWNGDSTLKHTTTMQHILGSIAPQKIPTKPWEPLETGNSIIEPKECDSDYQKMLDMFPLIGENILGYITVDGKKYLVGDKNGIPCVYTQMCIS